jgi:hypothetical protein
MVTPPRHALLTAAFAVLSSFHAASAQAQPPPAHDAAAPTAGSHEADAHGAAAPNPAAHEAAAHDAAHEAPAHEASAHGAPSHEADEGRAGAAHEGGEAEGPEPRVEVGADTVVGTGRRAGGGEGEGAERVTAASTVLEGSYRVVSSLRVGLLLPFSHEAINPAGERAFNENVLGNVALALTYRPELAPKIALATGLVLAAPTAAGDRFAKGEASAHAAEANEWSALTRAYAEDELFAPHRAGVVPSIGVEFRPGAAELGASVKVPLLAREGGHDPSRASGLTEAPLAVEIIPAASGFYNVRAAHLALGASAYVVYFAVDEVRARRGEPGRDEPKAQPVVEPEARVTLHPLHLALGYIVPVGGRLGGREQHAGGVRFALGAEI